MDEKKFLYFTLIIFVLMMSFPLFSTEYVVNGHDYLFHIARMEGMYESLQGGQFPVRINSYWFNGYGDPACVFYPNLFVYIPVLLRFCGFSMLVAYNIFNVIINFATVFINYWSFSKLFESRLKGAVASMVYSGFLYRIIDIYSRSALGETLAMAFMPFTLITLWLTLQRSNKYWYFIVIGFTGILQSHIISIIVTLIAAFIIIIYSFKRISENFKILVKTAAFTTLINLWFYIPFVDFYYKIKFNMQADFEHTSHLMHNTALTLGDFKIIQAFCGYWIFIIIAVFILHRLYLTIRNKEKFCSSNFAIMLIISLLITFAEMDYFPWHLFEKYSLIDKVLTILQFPYRFMTLGSITFTICLTNIIFYIYKRYFHFKLFLALCSFSLLICSMTFIYTFDKNTFTYVLHEPRIHFINWKLKHYPYMYKSFSYVGYTDYLYPEITFPNIMISSKEIYSEDEPPAPPVYVPKLIFDDIKPAENVSNFNKIGTTINFTADVDKPTTFKLPLFYFPGYKAYTSEGEGLNLSDSGDLHKIQVEVPAGQTHVTVKYYDKTLWRIANWISLISFIFFIINISRGDKYV